MRVLILVVMLVHVASAEPTDTPANPDTAATLSIVGTAVPLAAVSLGIAYHDQVPVSARLISTGIVGLVAGPSLGEFYAHRFGSRGVTTRMVGAAIIGFGALYWGLMSEDCGDSCGGAQAFGEGMVGVGAAVLATGIAFSIYDAPRMARTYNAAPALQIAPLVGRTSGLAVAGRF